MLVNKTSIQAVFSTLKTTFNKAFQTTETQWSKIAMKIPSTSSQNDYSWLSEWPSMRKWVGDKVVKALKAFRYTLENDDWEVTIGVKRNDIEDDNLGIYGPQAQNGGWAAAMLPEEIVGALVNGAFTNLCFDGQYFCDTDHPVGPEGAVTSVSNKGVSPLSCATKAAAEASIGAGRTAMRKFRNDEGQPLHVRPDLLVVPPALEDTARALATAEKLDDDANNPYRGVVEVLVLDALTSDTAWFLLDTTKPVRPFIYQERKAPVFVQQTGLDNDDVFSRGIYKFGAEARAAGGYGFWQLCYGSTGRG